MSRDGQSRLVAIEAAYRDKVQGGKAQSAHSVVEAVDEAVARAAQVVEDVLSEGGTDPEAAAAVQRNVEKFAASTRSMEEGIWNLESRGKNADVLVEILADTTGSWLGDLAAVLLETCGPDVLSVLVRQRERVLQERGA